ncbi:hypothetical protein E2C01_048310 [Portunus trituberculatus]|uniref:Uncharacterized protein n=1 Tax=Portunus trituberculatus TaxID=210409 RepID=A0A5B7GAH2_PORTR|nr:hypothetical protein [Portunus trituberculatus]
MTVSNTFSIDKSKSKRNEDHRNEWFHYSKANFGQLRSFFEGVNWKGVMETDDIEVKWATFMEIYNKRVKKWVPKRAMLNTFIKEWYNKRCATARLEREKAWNKWRKNRRFDMWTS